MPERRYPGIAKRSLDRSAMLTQLLFAAAILVIMAGFLLVDAEAARADALFVGLAVVLVTSGLAIGMPWHRFGAGWVAILPFLDIFAIGWLRLGLPDAAVGLLWIFPSIWLSTYFSIAVMAVAYVAIGVILALTYALLGPTGALNTLESLVILPLTIMFVSVASYLSAVRSRAQRRLLRKQADLLEDALARARDEERLIAEVLDAVDFGVIRIGPHGKVKVMNAAFARLQSAAGTIGDETPHYAADGVTPLPKEAHPLSRLHRREEFGNVVAWIGKPGERRIALSNTGRLLRGDNGEDQGAVLVSRDVTSELKAIRARDDLIASVSHELRTPLTSILGYLEMVLDDPDLHAEARASLEIALRNADRLLELLGDILIASQDEDAAISFEFAVCDLGEIVDASVESLMPKAAERSITVTVTTAGPAEVTADPSRIRQVVDNVLSNAIKYNRQGGEITVGATIDDRFGWIIVRDTGIGIDEEELPKLFERYFRSESVRKSSVHGSGLGLGISRDIVRRHGGELTIQSVKDEGSTVVIRVPIHQAEKSTPLFMGATNDL